LPIEVSAAGQLQETVAKKEGCCWPTVLLSFPLLESCKFQKDAVG
jgi:hypothetical protein